MANDIKTSQSGGGDHLGITFGEIHSDEPHEAVTASKTDVVQKHTSTPQSHLSNKDDVFNVTKAYADGHTEIGTIVSDKKDSRPSVGQNMLSAISEWWGAAKETIDDSATMIQAPLIKKEEPVISKVETRADVVKTAATHATMAPKDDHKVVIQKIRTFKQDVARVQNTPVVIKEKSEKQSGWGYTKEEKASAPVPQIEPEKFVASVAVDQKMIPTPPKNETPVPPQSAPLPPVPPSSIPKPPRKELPQEKVVVTPPAPVTQAPQEVAPVGSAHRMNVPDTVVKKETLLPKKNIWVAPRVQPESSVLTPHSEPTPVSQSFIPHQNPTPQKPVPVPTVAQPALATPPVVATKTEAPTPTPIVAPVTPIKPPEQGLSKPFHDSSPTQSVETPKIPDVKPAPVSVPSVPQQSVSVPPPASVPSVRPPVETSASSAIWKEVQNVPSVTQPQVPQQPVPQPAPVTPFKTSLTPPQIHPPTLYKKVTTEVSPQPAPVTIPPEKLIHTSTPQIHKAPTPQLREIPKVNTEEEGGYKNAPPPAPPKPVAFTPQEEAPKPTFILPRKPIPVVAEEQAVLAPVTPIEKEVVRSYEVPRETFAPEVPRSEKPQSRPTALPPIERVISSPVPEEAVRATSPNNAFRTFVRWAVLACIVLFGIALALFASIYFDVFKKETVPENTPITVSTFIETNTQTPLMIEGTKELFLSTLKDHVAKADAGLTQLYPTVKEGEVTRPGTTAEILQFLNARIDQRTLKSLNSTLMIGSVTTTKNEPFVVLQSSNFDVLFTGLIAWEPNLYTDFAPLFGETVPTQIKFKDAVRDNSSTRILYDDSGKEMLLYSFINQNTVVITTSGEALSELIKKFRSGK